jgi:HEPN domain-containing protein
LIDRQDLIRLARTRFRDAEILFDGQRFDGAAYLCGYAIELKLKARICRTLRWPWFPSTRREFQDLSSFRTHDLEVLLQLSGIEARILSTLRADWDEVVDWGPADAIPSGRNNHPRTVQTYDYRRTRIAESNLTPLLKKVRKVKDQLVQKYGPIWIFGLVRRSKSIHTWSILICAPWASKEDSKLLRSIYTLLKRELTSAENRQLGRILFVEPGDPFVEQFFRRIGGVYDQATVHVVGPLLGNRSIIEGYVIAAENPRPVRAA